MPIFFLSVPFVSVVMHITHENSIKKTKAEPLVWKRVTSRRNEDSVRLERRAEYDMIPPSPFSLTTRKVRLGLTVESFSSRVCQFRKVFGPDPAYEITGVVLVLG